MEPNHSVDSNKSHLIKLSIHFLYHLSCSVLRAAGPYQWPTLGQRPTAPVIRMAHLNTHKHSDSHTHQTGSQSNPALMQLVNHFTDSDAPNRSFNAHYPYDGVNYRLIIRLATENVGRFCQKFAKTPIVLCVTHLHTTTGQKYPIGVRDLPFKHSIFTPRAYTYVCTHQIQVCNRMMIDPECTTPLV